MVAPGRPPDHLFPFTAIAVCVALALELLPAPRHDYREVVGAGIVGAAIVVLALGAARLPPIVLVVIPVGYLLMVALLRDGGGGSDSGFGGLFLLPVVWLGFTGSRRAIASIIVAMVVAELIPLVLVGHPRYPSSGWRAALVLSSVAALIGFMIQRIVGDARRYTAQLQHQAADLEQASRLLAEQNERLVELDGLKDEFLAAVSHELRTPLTSISGYLEMALQPDDPPIPATQRTYLATVERNVARLSSLVNDLLLLARGDSRALRLELADVDLVELVKEAADTARPAAMAKHVGLDLEAPVPAAIVRCDRAQLGQLLDNLVGNAVKFTPANGRIHLSVRQEDGRSVVVEVSDTGIGIPADDLPQIFERFFRASTATGSGIPGTGLGLAISQLIARAHGTAIAVESTVGQGTTFRFSLPTA